MNKYLKQLLDARAKKNLELQSIMTKALDDGTTPNEDDENQIAQIEADIAAIEVNIERVKKQIQAIKDAEASGTEVEGEDTEQGNDSTKGRPSKIVVVSNMEKGIGFAKFVRAKMISALEAKSGNYISALDVAKSRNEPKEVLDLIQKATQGTTTDVNFGASLVKPNHLVDEFVELLRANTVFDKLVGMRRVPFNSNISSQLTGSAAGWVGEGLKKPLTNPTYGDVDVKEHKLAAIVVMSQELIRRSSPSADALVRDDLILSASTLIDTTFLGTQAATAVLPVGMLNGVTGITSTGVTAEAYANDLRALRAQFITNNLSLNGASYLMSEIKAAELADVRDALGNAYFRGMDAPFGQKTLNGIPVIESENVLLKIILIKASEILLADDGVVDISYSDQATLVDGATTINLWQENKFAIRAERFITWAKRRAIAASFIQYT